MWTKLPSLPFSPWIVAVSHDLKPTEVFDDQPGSMLVFGGVFPKKNCVDLDLCISFEGLYWIYIVYVYLYIYIFIYSPKLTGWTWTIHLLFPRFKLDVFHYSAAMTAFENCETWITSLALLSEARRESIVANEYMCLETGGSWWAKVEIDVESGCWP